MFKALIPIWLTIGSILSGCPFKSDKEARKAVDIQHIGNLNDISESSGLMYLNDSTVFTHSDSGNPSILYQFSILDFETKAQHQLAASNRDWEDITADNKGNIYVGDIGNNGNARRDLHIYTFDSLYNLINTISYAYPDQKEFPPENKKDWNYDCEAFFWLNDHLYLFSKNINYPYTRIYDLNPESGAISLLDSLELKSPITAADVRSDGQEAVLLTYGKVFFLDVSGDPPVFSPALCVNFNNSGQSEAIAYVNDSAVLITNEKGKVHLLTR